ncbi:OTOP-like protein [Mya arenaria]|uniref:OTOP-like protein n=1 Tax=Mya arenaria TaxID=6604 RepID=A0ABY7DP23_MYAAR|nr:OTOP-like protein [Mya arenaria]
MAESIGFKTSVSCLRPGIPESDTGESGEESEPTYRHYDNFETDVCLTQDEDDDADDSSNPASNVVVDVGKNLSAVGTGAPSVGIVKKLLGSASVIAPNRTSPPTAPKVDVGVNNVNRVVSSDSDSCTESEQTLPQGQTTDDTTTSTSESEETQIWVPVSKRPSAKQLADTTTTPPVSATSSNGSDGSRPQSYIIKAGSPGPNGVGTGSLSYIAERVARRESRSGRAGSSESARRGSRDRDSWHTLQSNQQSSGVQKRVSPSKPMSAVGLLRHDEATGTITLDIRNLPNGEIGLGEDDEHVTPGSGEDAGVTGTVSSPMVRSPPPQRRPSSDFARMGFGESLCVLVSGLYMLCLVVAGLVIPLAQAFAVKSYPALFEGFYIYLYILSIAFLTYVYTYLLRMRTVPRKRRERTVVSSLPPAKRRSPLESMEEPQTGSFYLRLGAVGFGIGSMIKSGLHFGEYFEMTSSCSHVLHGIRPILHLCFTFTQLYFVFLNSKMCTRQYSYLARFGLMHMLATNVAVWLQEVVRETLRELATNEMDSYRMLNITAGQVLSKVVEEPPCHGDSLMGEVVGMASSYLYPCSVLYIILFVMWLKLGHKEGKPEQEVGVSKSVERSSVDCSNSSRGLFLGIIVFVAAVIILITFFVLVRTENFLNTAVRLDHLGDVALFVVTIIAVVLVFHRTYGLRYPEHDTGPGFEDAMLVLSLIGVYLLCVANIIAASLTIEKLCGHLVILSNSLRLVQATVQTVYLLCTMRRRVWRREQAEKRSGREFVTFLLICNIALWGMNIFEVQMSNANPLQEEFYGHVTWSIITHASLPLAIMFRFLSTVCLANIWKHAWRLKM